MEERLPRKPILKTAVVTKTVQKKPAGAKADDGEAQDEENDEDDEEDDSTGRA